MSSTVDSLLTTKWLALVQAHTSTLTIQRRQNSSVPAFLVRVSKVKRMLLSGDMSPWADRHGQETRPQRQVSHAHPGVTGMAKRLDHSNDRCAMLTLS